MLLAVSKNSLQGIFQIFENINLASTMIARFTGLAKCLLTCRSALTVPMAKANFVTVGCPGYRNIPRKATCSKGDTVTRKKKRRKAGKFEPTASNDTNFIAGNVCIKVGG